MTTASAITTPSTASTASGGQKLVGNNFNTFLRMLTTQMTHQNPLSPMDTHEFTAQLVQFSQVEQLMNMSQSVEKSLGFQESGNLLAAAQMIGRDIRARTATLRLEGGQAPLSYELPAARQAATLVISDSSGTPVMRKTVPATAGRHDLVWDGRDQNGLLRADGVYGVHLVTQDTAGQTETIPIVADVRVLSVRREAAGVSVVTESGTVALGDITEMR
jgi:flagellar basal-body rod modification protein FlgD